MKINDIIDNLKSFLNIDVGGARKIPKQLILTGGAKRSGISSSRIFTNVISRKGEAGLPIGNLPTGKEDPNDIMIRIIIEEIVKEIQENAIVNVGIKPGVNVLAQGASPAGNVVVKGRTIKSGEGYGIIQ